MLERKIDYSYLLNNRIHSLTILEIIPYENRKVRTRALCLCNCGNQKVIRVDCLLDGNTTSCGCVQKKNFTNRTHGASHGVKKMPEYKVWTGMKQRCLNPNHVGYKHWGGRGIKVCDRWLEFKNFIEDMGARPSDKYSLDRINNNGHYEPENCRWVTRDIQNLNTSRSPKGPRLYHIVVPYRFAISNWRFKLDSSNAFNHPNAKVWSASAP